MPASDPTRRLQFNRTGNRITIAVDAGNREPDRAVLSMPEIARLLIRIARGVQVLLQRTAP